MVASIAHNVPYPYFAKTQPILPYHAPALPCQQPLNPPKVSLYIHKYRYPEVYIMSHNRIKRALNAQNASLGDVGVAFGGADAGVA